MTEDEMKKYIVQLETTLRKTMMDRDAALAGFRELGKAISFYQDESTFVFDVEEDGYGNIIMCEGKFLEPAGKRAQEAARHPDVIRAKELLAITPETPNTSHE